MIALQKSNISTSQIYKAAIYVRLSKEDGDVSNAKKAESNSISNQKQLIKNYLKSKNDIEIVSEWVDDGYTGSNFDRPAFRQMLKEVESGKINCIVVKDLSRFGREYIDSGKYLEKIFPSFGVRFIAINDNYDTNNQNYSSDEIVIPMKNVINDAYCKDISVKIRSHLETKRQNGEFIGSFTPYGYKKSDLSKNQLEIDDYAAGIVQDIFKWKIAGMSQDAIANKLNKERILSPLEYKRSLGLRYSSGFKMREKAQWSAVTIKRILQDEVYIGVLTQGIRTTPNHKLKIVIRKEQDKWARVENAHEPIVSLQTFEQVQRLLQLDTRTAPSGKMVYMLSGIAVCGDCGSLMTRKATTVNGKKYVYYLCSENKLNKTCSSHRISESVLENSVLLILRQYIQVMFDMKNFLSGFSHSDLLRIDLKRLVDRRKAQEDEYRKIVNLKMSLYEDYKKGLICEEDYKDINEQFSLQAEEARNAIDESAQKLETMQMEGSSNQNWINRFLEHKNIEHLTRTIIVELIDSIKVFENKQIEVSFSYGQEYERLMEYKKLLEKGVI